MKGTFDERICLVNLFCYFSMTRSVLSDEDKAVENAKWGLGIAAVVGMFMQSFIKLLMFLHFQVDCSWQENSLKNDMMYNDNFIKVKDSQ